VIVIDHRDTTAWIGINTGRPGNAMHAAAMSELADAVEQAAGNSKTSLLVLYSERTSFCAGADVSVLEHASPEQFWAYAELQTRLFEIVDRAPALTVAALRGACIGAGAELAMCCDLRVAGAELRFGYPEVRLGFPVNPTRLTRAVGAGFANELIFSAELADAQTCLRRGVVNHLIPAGDWLTGIEAAIAPYTGLDRNAVVHTKLAAYEVKQPKPDAAMFGSLLAMSVRASRLPPRIDDTETES